MTLKTYLTIGTIALIIILGISLTLSVKRCVSWKKQYSEVRKELELARKIQAETRAADERVNNETHRKIETINNSSDIASDLNRLLQSDIQTIQDNASR